MSGSEPETLIWALIDERSNQNRQTVPIIFIGHSLGGTLIKQVFVQTSSTRTSQDVLLKLHQNISAIVFLGTRHHGDFKPQLRQLSMLRKISVAYPATAILHVMEQIPDVNREFRLLKGESLPITSFRETVPMPIFGNVRVFVETWFIIRITD